MREGQASRTAQRVAAQRAVLPRAPADHGDPAADQRLQADVAASLDAPSGRRLSPYLGRRTAFFDGVVVTALDDGVTQVVVAGAGYDGRAWRYARPGVRWFELDHPATQADKRERLQRLGIAAGEVTFVAADFTQDDVAARLADAGVDPGRPALHLCEGVAGYLDDTVLTALLRALAGAAAPGSTLAMTMPFTSESTGRSQALRGRLAAAVARIGEPLTFALPRADLDDFLAAAGWRTVSATDPGGTPVATSQLGSGFILARTPTP